MWIMAMMAAPLLMPRAAEARWLDVNKGRFITMDSYEGNPKRPITLHTYLYADANPVNKVDPSGRFSIGQTFTVASIGGTLAAISAPYIVNAPGPKDEVYPPISTQDIFAHYTVGFVTAGVLNAAGQGVRGGIDSMVARRLSRNSDAVRINIAEGAGYQSKTAGGKMYTGGYDPKTRTVYLGDNGHPQGVAAAGGNANAQGIAGITMVEAEQNVMWNNVSASLRGKLTEPEVRAINEALEKAFPEKVVTFMESLR
jgi:hypothetical protein